MKQIFTLIICSLFCFTAAFAQLDDGEIAPDFVVTDLLDDSQHHLQNYLDSGKTVIIDLFATWCGPCWTLHTNHVLEDIWTAYGPDGTDEVVVMAIESDPSTSTPDVFGNGGNTIGDWSDGISYILAEDDIINDQYDQSFYPSIFMIRPSGRTILINDYCWDNLLMPERDWVYDLVDRGPNDIAISTLLTDRIACGNITLSPSVNIQNLGTSDLTTATINLLIDGNVEQTKVWNGNLPEFDRSFVAFFPINVEGGSAIDFEAVMPNEMEDMFTLDNAVGIDISSNGAMETVTFTITTDFWPEEIGWQIVDPNGAVIHSNADVGTLSCDQTYMQEVTLTDFGCYELRLTDAFGDGLLNGSVNPASHSCNTPNGQASTAMGAISLVGDGINIFWDNISYGSGVDVPFEYQMSSSVADIDALSDVALYPNPANDYVTAEFALAETTEIKIEVVDMLGRSVRDMGAQSYAPGTHDFTLNTSDLTVGTYMMRMTDGKGVNSIKFNVAR